MKEVLRVDRAFQRYGGITALDGVSIGASEGEFLTLLGHSGSGKSTLLRVIAGLEIPTEITGLEIDGLDVRNVPANRRNCATVFQQYALFPHMNVIENIEYGLKVRGIPAGERRKQARELLELMQLGSRADSRIHQLSGGQRQRVALARALVIRPKLLLLDEPLAALDEKLRVEMQIELMHLHRKIGLTFIYVTHSQEEAVTMSDRIILMRGGRVAQEGTPVELFERPRDPDVAKFMGVENIFESSIIDINQDSVRFQVGDQFGLGVWTGEGVPALGQKVSVAIRAERLKTTSITANAEMPTIRCDRGELIYKGKYLDQILQSPVGKLTARIFDRVVLPEVVEVWWTPADCAVTALETKTLGDRNG